MIQVVDHNSPLQKQSITLRDLVLRQPLNLKFSKEELAKESDSFHIVYIEKEQVIGCLILKPVSKQVMKMRQVAVHPSQQGKGIGKQLVHFCEQFAKENGASSIELHARANVLPFYKRLNYTVVGDEFLEVGLPHFKMVKEL